MCLFSSTIIPLIATEDITCYKIVRKNSSKSYSSLYYRSFQWKLNKKRKINNKEIRDGIEKCGAWSLGYKIHNGFHSYREIPFWFLAWRKESNEIESVILRCTIPKGSKYYIGNMYSSNEYVSNQLIPIDDITESIEHYSSSFECCD